MVYKSGRTRPIIGVLAGWQFYRTATNFSYLTPLFRGIGRAVLDMGCHAMVGCGMGFSASSSDPFRPAWPTLSPEHDFVPIGPWNTDGLIVAVPLHSQSRSADLQRWLAQGHPVLFISSGENGPTISADNATGILEALHHFIEHGHRQVAFIAGSKDDLLGDTGERLRAYSMGCQLYKLVEDPRLVCYGSHSYSGGQTAISQLLKTGVSFSAVLCSNDESAFGAIKALKEAGLRVPQDIAVIGFDNRIESLVHNPSLTTVNVPLFNMGYHAVELLMDQIEGRAPLPDSIKVDSHLVIRESCGCDGRDYLNLVQRAETIFLDTEPIAEIPLVKRLTTVVLNQAHNLKKDDANAFCQRLVQSLIEAVEHSDPSIFDHVLTEVLAQTATGDEDAHIWYLMICLLGTNLASLDITALTAIARAQDILEQAKFKISAYMQHQHEQYVIDERWTNSRISILTDRLLSTFDEAQIYHTLATYLPDMGIQTAMIGFFEANSNGSDPIAYTVLRNVIGADQALVRCDTRQFPPLSLIASEDQFLWTLIPLVKPAGKVGYMVFDITQFSLYGMIVQQVGGALNSAQLYSQATEGRRLAEEANRMKSRFLSTISHELRTSLNLIVSMSGMLVRDNDDSSIILPEAIYKKIEQIHAYSQHLGSLISDVIDLATSDAGQLRLNNNYIDLGQALRVVAQSGQQLAADKGLTWQAYLPDSGPWVWGDKTRLRQIILNLVSNAIKFTMHGTVTLTVEDDGKLVTVTVRDTGLGIPPEEQAIIFDEFHQSQRSVERGYGGLGLGLAISKRLIDMHGGIITVQSSGEEGAGSMFVVKLPVIQPLPKVLSGSEMRAMGAQSVVVMTDQPTACHRLFAHLQQRGFSVHTLPLTDEPRWYEQLQTWQPDMIIIDAAENQALGWDVFKGIQRDQTLGQLPVLFYSAGQPNDSLLELDYLSKPIDLSELTKALDQQVLRSEQDQPVRNILVVDDEPHTLEMHTQIVQAHSSINRVLKAHNGKEALDILHRDSVDLILLDLQMPEMDGFEVLEVIRSMETTSKIPVIVITGTVLTEADMRRLHQGVAAVLGKGLFTVEETIAHIQTALAQKRKLSSEAQRLVRLAMSYLHEHYTESISRRDIAQYVGITEDHLTFCFRQELGATPVAYLQRYRINQSKRLLKDSDLTIADIASHVGFADSGYFSRIFRREVGMSPESFRRS